MALAPDPDNIRLAMIGMVEGNGHPYSWSAIINGRFDAAEIARCPYSTIGQYLSAQPKEALGISGVRVTHIWCDDPADARHVAAASFIPNVVKNPTDVIGQVDAVIIPTDRGEEHLDRARPFIEAGLPLFIDKPLTDREDHLRQFVAWHRQGKRFMSSSCMRYASEFASLGSRMHEIGTPRVISVSMCKSLERYGIHALEAAYALLRPGGWQSVSCSGDERAAVVHIRHADGVEVVVLQSADAYAALAHMTLYGTNGVIAAQFTDTFAAFKAQLLDFVQYLRTGREPYAFEQTVELMTLLIAALRTRHAGGTHVVLSGITP